MPFLEIGYKKIHYTELKPENDKPARETFIFMHGLGSSQNYYYAVAQGLQAKDFHCIIFDTTGSARSPYTQIEQTIESLAEDIIGILDALKVEKAVVVGHSMGGIVAAHLAAERNDRVVAAIFIGPVYPNKTFYEPIFQGRIETVEKHGMQPLADTVPFAALGTKASPIAKVLVRELLLGQDPAGYCSMCRVIINADVPEYSKIRVPILIIAGAEDKSAPVESSRKMFEEIGTEEKKMEVMDGVGHWQCVEAPEDVGRLIEGFYHDIQ